MYGKRGGKVRDMNVITKFLQRIRPDTIILVMGSNEICSELPSNTYADVMVKVCDKWLEYSFVKSLVWCQVTNRNYKAKMGMDATKYNRKAFVFNS